MDEPVPHGATVSVDDRQLLKMLHWYDGFVVCLANPGFLIATLGASIGTLGALGAFALWTLSMLIAVAQNKIYTEPATMFPDRSGGIPIYAHEGWRRYFTFVGPMAAIGYWAAWSVVLAINGLVIGSLITAQWFPKSTWTIHVGVALTPPRLIAVALIVAVWAFNAVGVKPAVWVAYATGALIVIPLALFMIFPYLTGNFRTANLTWLIDDNGGSLGNSWRLVLVWLYLMGWSSYGVESAATFAPEYKDTERDTALALRRSAAFSLVVYALLPLGVGGVLSHDKIAAGALDYSFYVAEIDKMIGAGASFILPLLIAAFILAMNTATMDGSRALYGISKSGMTIKWLGRLNRFHVPGRAMTVDMILNILVVLVLNSTIAILAASNLGYILCHVFALSAVLLMRRDLPAWPRPLRLSQSWLWMAALLTLANLAFVLVGAPSFQLTGYGGYQELFVGIGVLVIAVLLYAYRRIVEDREPLRLRDMSPTVAMTSPTAGPAAAPTAAPRTVSATRTAR